MLWYLFVLHQMQTPTTPPHLHQPPAVHPRMHASTQALVTFEDKATNTAIWTSFPLQSEKLHVMEKFYLFFIFSRPQPNILASEIL